MKKTALLLVFLLCSALPLMVSCGSGSQTNISATISFLSGKVTILEDGKSVLAKKGMHIGVNGVIKTDTGAKAKLLFDDGAKILIEENSELVMKELAKPSQESTLDIVVELAKGIIYFDVTKRKSSKFQMDSSVAVSGVKGTKGTFQVDGNSNRWVLVTGKLEIATKKLIDDKKYITKGEQMVLDKDGNLKSSKVNLATEKFFGVPLLSDPDANISVITGN